MITTSNTVEHRFSVLRLKTVGESNNFNNVVTEVEVLLESSVFYEKSFDTVVYETPLVGISTTVVENKVSRSAEKFSTVLNTSGIGSHFTDYKNLSEEQVLGWVFDSDREKITQVQSRLESIVLLEKDKDLNPKKYQYDFLPLPW